MTKEVNFPPKKTETFNDLWNGKNWQKKKSKDVKIKK